MDPYVIFAQCSAALNSFAPATRRWVYFSAVNYLTEQHLIGSRLSSTWLSLAPLAVDDCVRTNSLLMRSKITRLEVTAVLWQERERARSNLWNAWCKWHSRGHLTWLLREPGSIRDRMLFPATGCCWLTSVGRAGFAHCGRLWVVGGQQWFAKAKWKTFKKYIKFKFLKICRKKHLFWTLDPRWTSHGAVGRVVGAGYLSD